MTSKKQNESVEPISATNKLFTLQPETSACWVNEKLKNQAGELVEYIRMVMNQSIKLTFS